MKLYAPSYMKAFKCKGSECHDNCCIGWEIDIDDVSLKKYRTMSLSDGNPLSDGVENGESPHFKQDDTGRCHFLTSDGLCRIISELGEAALCDICREHPRYYNVLGNFAEVGIGLVCEAATELLLKSSTPFTVYEYGCTDCENRRAVPPSIKFASRQREAIFEMIFNEKIDTPCLLSSLFEMSFKIEDTVLDVEAGLLSIDIAPISLKSEESDLSKPLTEFIRCAKDAEFFDDEFPTMLNDITRLYLSSPDTFRNFLRRELDCAARRLLWYFVHRYFLSGLLYSSIGAALRFSILSTLTVCLLTLNAGGTKHLSRTAIIYSKNIEYSQSNVEMLTEALF